MKSSIFFLLLLFLPMGLSAAEENPIRYTVGLEYAGFRYTEQPMKEDMPMYGIGGQVIFPIAQIMRIYAEGDFVTGSGTYDGHYSQSGAELKTDTDTNVLNLRAMYGYDFTICGICDVTPFAGVGMRFLANRISGSGGYRREVDYLYLPLGADLRWDLGAGWSATLRPEYDVFVSGHVKSYLSDVDSKNPDVDNYQTSGSGFQIAGTVMFPAMGGFQWGLQAFYQEWNIEDSDHYYTTDGYLYEPKNKTITEGLNLLVSF